MITLVPVGGLGNRIRAIDSARSLAEKTGHELTVVWEKRPYLASAFGELFEYPRDVRIFDTLPYERRQFWRLDLLRFRPREHSRPGLRQIGALVQGAFYNAVLSYDEIYALTKKGWDLDWVRGTPNLLIFSDYCFFEGPFHRELFVPVSALRGRIDAVAAAFAPYTVGVHVRRQDNTRAIEHSPDALFVKRLHEIFDSNSEAMCYLATDCADTERRLMAVFPNRIVTSTPCRVRSSQAGMADAVMDMFCLARTQYILASYWSSFGRMAALLGAVEMEIVNVKEEGQGSDCS